MSRRTIGNAVMGAAIAGYVVVILGLLVAAGWLLITPAIVEGVAGVERKAFPAALAT